MRTLMIVVSWGLILAAAGAEGGTAGGMDLWDKARAIYTENFKLVPSRAETTFEKLDQKGKVTSSTVVVHSGIVGKDGKAALELQSSMTDGRDTTGMQRRNEADGKPNPYAGGPGKMSFRLDSSPFDEREKGLVTAEQGEETRTIGGALCRSYSFKWLLPDAQAAYAGIAWIDEATGAPILVEYSMDPRPSMLKSCTIRVSYEAGTPGQWFLSERIVDRESQNLGMYMHVRTKEVFAAPIGGK
jgi:hypothetical protein